MAVLSVNKVIRAGIAENNVAAAAGGDLLPNTGVEWLEFANTNASPYTVTINGYVDGVAVAIQTVSIPATTGRKKVGPFPPSIYNNASNQVSITYSGVTGLSVGAYSL